MDALLIRLPDSTFFVRFEGDAMAGFGINDGDLLVVERCTEYQPDQIVLAFVGDHRVVRQFQQFSTGPVLCPANQRYNVIAIAGDVEIFGRVIHSITHHLKVVAYPPEAS